MRWPDLANKQERPDDRPFVLSLEIKRVFFDDPGDEKPLYFSSTFVFSSLVNDLLVFFSFLANPSAQRGGPRRARRPVSSNPIPIHIIHNK